MKFFILVACVIGVALCTDPIQVEVESSSAVDLSGTDFTTKFCEKKEHKCNGNTINTATFSATAKQCLSKCAREPTCESANWNTVGDKKCFLTEKRCTEAELEPAQAVTELYRLKQGEECPAGRAPFVASLINYSSLFCLMSEKRCPGKDLYPKPQNIAPVLECLKKCAKIESCGMVDFHDDKCSPKEYSCEDNELDPTGPSYDNYLRLPEGETTCPEGRTAAATEPAAPAPEPAAEPEPAEPETTEPAPAEPETTEPAPAEPETTAEPVTTTSAPKFCRHYWTNCLGHDINTIYDTPSLDVCERHCANDPRCLSAIREHSRTCWLKNYVCWSGRPWGMADYTIKNC